MALQVEDRGTISEGSRPDRLFTFATLTDLLRAEWECQQMGVSTQIEPVPPCLTQGCHMCLSLEGRDADWLEAKLQSMGLTYGCYDRPATIL